MSGGAGVVLEGVVRGGAVLLFALAFARGRSLSAVTRHLALAAALAWVIVLPLQVAIGPEWRLTVLPPEPIDARPSVSAPVTLSSSRAPSVAELPSERGGPAGPSATAASVAARADDIASTEAGAARGRGGSRRGVEVADRSLLARVADLVLPVYLGGVALLMLLRVAGMLRIRRIRSRARPASDRIARAAVLAADHLGVPVVRPRVSDECSLPFVSGLIRPAIVLPSSAAGGSPERLEAVLSHEMAHVRRRDPLTALIVDLGRAVGWPIPFAWIAARRARSLAEQACDGAVVRAGIPRERYADVLVGFARDARGSRLLAAPGMAKESGLTERIEVLLTDGARPRPSRALATACAVAALMIGALAGACVPTRATGGFDGTAAETSNVSDGGTDLSTNAAGLQTRWSDDGRHSGVFVTGDVDIERVLAGEADTSAVRSVVAMSEDGSGRIRVFAWPGDATIAEAPWARRTLAIAARRLSNIDYGTDTPRSDRTGGGGQGGVVVRAVAPRTRATNESADVADAPAPRPDPLPSRERLSGSTMAGTGPSLSRDPGAGVIQAGWIDDGRRTGVFMRGDWSIHGIRLDSPDRDAWIVLFTFDPRDGRLRRLRAWRGDRGIEVDHRVNGRSHRLDDAALRWAEQVLSTLARIRRR